MSAMTSQITGVSIICSSVGSGEDKKTSKLRVTGLWARNWPVDGEFPAQKANNAENVSIWWCHRDSGRELTPNELIFKVMICMKTPRGMEQQ